MWVGGSCRCAWGEDEFLDAGATARVVVCLVGSSASFIAVVAATSLGRVGGEEVAVGDLAVRGDSAGAAP